MKAGCITLCLLLVGHVTAMDLPSGHEPKPLSDEEIASRKENFKNPEKLKAFLMDAFVEFDWSGAMTEPQQIHAFKDGYDIKDTTIRSALLDIYRESVQKTGWKYGDNWQAEFRLHSAIFWMGIFADEPAKELLLGIASDSAKDVFYRYPAIFGYIYCADLQEVRDLFTWLLDDEKRFPANLRATFAEQIRRLWKSVETDKPKREVILASLSTVADREKDVRTFRSLDDFLTQNNKEYAESFQRKASLERMSKTLEKDAQ